LVAGLATYAAPKAPVKPAEPTVAVGELPPNVVAQHIVLSYIDPKRCIDMLKAFGYRIIEAGQPVDAKALPAVMMAPSTKFSDLPNPKKTFPQTETDPVANLLVFYDTTQPDQLSHLLQRIRTVIDTPARQIMIEAMVLRNSGCSGTSTAARSPAATGWQSIPLATCGSASWFFPMGRIWRTPR
jgi:hypothetical protein